MEINILIYQSRGTVVGVYPSVKEGNVRSRFEQLLKQEFNVDLNLTEKDTAKVMLRKYYEFCITNQEKTKGHEFFIHKETIEDV